MICEESADTIQCIISLLDTYNISYEDLIEKLKEKNIKWESVVKKRMKNDRN
jgi:phosphoribosyl-ATP pyrophosphohydrolase